MSLTGSLKAEAVALDTPQGALSPEQEIPDAAVRAQVERISRSAPFVRSSRITHFLSFIVDSTIRGQYDVLKETCIGNLVFGREPDYDPKIDPIVRVEARRLRAKLQEYYETEGRADRIVITMPKGGYRPTIQVRPVATPPIFPVEAPLGAPVGAPLDVTPGAILPSTAGAAPMAGFPASAEHRQAAQPGWRARPGLWLGAVGAIVALLALGAFFLHRGRSSAVLTRLTPLTSYLGEEFNPSLSPDGRHLAFTWDNDRGLYSIYVQTIPRGEPVQLSHSQGQDLHPVWSPDGRDLAFLRVTPKGSQVITIPSTGGPERTIGQVQNSVSVWRADAMQMPGSAGPAWSPRGDALYVNDGGAIYRWPLGYGARTKVTEPPSANNDFYPAISPDGRWIAFARQTSNSTYDLYAARLSDDHPVEPVRLTTDRTDIRGLAWSPDGAAILFSSRRSGTHELWQASLHDHSLRHVPIGSREAIDPTIDQRGSLLAYTELTQNTNIWRLPLGPAGHAVPERAIASSGRNNSPQYSPDGQRIAFVSDRSGAWELWVCGADGSQPRQLTSFRGPMLGTPHWSPDGRWIAFDARPGDHSKIFLIASDGGQPRQLAVNDFEERMPNWSADGRSVYFNSTRSGEVRLWKVALDGSNPRQISDRPAYDNFEAEDGKTVYFRSEGAGIWMTPSEGGASTLVPPLAHVESSRYLAVTSHALWFVDQEDAPRRILAYNFATHRVSAMGTIDHTLVSGTPSLSVSPDERSVVFAQQDQSASDILGVPWASVR